MMKHHLALGEERFLNQTTPNDFTLPNILSTMRALPTEATGNTMSRHFYAMEMYTPWPKEPTTDPVTNPHEFAGEKTEVEPYFSA